MLGQRRRRWANIWQTFGNCVVFAVLEDTAVYSLFVHLGPNSRKNYAIYRRLRIG